MADNVLKIDSFTDESGQDTKGKLFVVATAVVLSEEKLKIEEELIRIEGESGKIKKWFHTGNKIRHRYIKAVLESGILSKIKLYYSTYSNKMDYESLVGSHIAKAILQHVDDNGYITKVFIDKMDKGTLKLLQKEIKSYHIRYKKIRGLADESSALVRLADSLCGLIRDLDNKNVANNYKKLFSKIKEV